MSHHERKIANRGASRIVNAVAAVVMLSGYVSVCAVQAQVNPNYTIDCGAECDEKAYPYQFCVERDGKSEFVIKCSSQPNNETDEFGNPMKVYKAHIFLNWFCTDYDHASSTFYINFTEENTLVVTERLETGDIDHTVFAPSTIQQCVWGAMNKWVSACQNPENPSAPFISTSVNQCCLKIVWTQDERLLLRDRDGNLNLARTSFQGSSTTSCAGIDCGQSGVGGPTIYLNQNPEWMNADSKGFPKRFFYTETLSSYANSTLVQGDYEYYSLCYTIMHEIGHYLGFQHPDGKDTKGNELNCPEDAVSVMKEQAQKFTDYNPPNNQLLTDDDRCMFAKLYCCAATVVVTGVSDDGSLDEGDGRFACLDQTRDNPITVVVYSMAGERLAEYSLTIRTAGMATGMRAYNAIKEAMGVQVPGLYLVVATSGGCLERMRFLVSQ